MLLANVCVYVYKICHICAIRMCYSSVVRNAPQMFQTGVLSIYFIPRCEFSLIKKNRTLEQCILITCVGETQTFLLHCLVIICSIKTRRNI